MLLGNDKFDDFLVQDKHVIRLDPKSRSGLNREFVPLGLPAWCGRRLIQRFVVGNTFPAGESFERIANHH